MEIREARTEAARPEGSWGLVLSELVLIVAMSAALLALVWRVPGGRADADFLLLIIVGLYVAAFARFAMRIASFLSYTCPACAENFHGCPERLPRPFRRRCAHCGEAPDVP